MWDGVFRCSVSKPRMTARKRYWWTIVQSLKAMSLCFIWLWSLVFELNCKQFCNATYGHIILILDWNYSNSHHHFFLFSVTANLFVFQILPIYTQKLSNISLISSGCGQIWMFFSDEASIKITQKWTCRIHLEHTV